MSIEDLENKITLQEKKISEIEIKNERMEEEIESFYEEFEVNQQNLSLFISQKENFSDGSWEILQAEKQKAESKLARDLENIANPFRLKKVYKQRKVETHWLFVR